MRKLCTLPGILLLLASVLLLTSCQTQEPTAGNKFQTASSPAEVKSRGVPLRDFGLRWSVPYTVTGTFGQPGEGNASFFFDLRAFSLLHVADVGEMELDDYSIANSAAGLFNLPFPNSSLIQKPSTEADGRRWLHYVFTNEQNGMCVYIDAAHYKNLLCILTTFSPKSYEKLELKWTPQKMWSYVQFNNDFKNVAPSGHEKDVSLKILYGLFGGYTARGRYDEALRVLDRIDVLSPYDETSGSLRALVLAQTGRYEEALPKVDQLCKKYPTSGHILWRKGFIEAKLGHYGEALGDFNYAIYNLKTTEDPAIVEYINVMAEAHLLGKRVDEVEKLASTNGTPVLQIYLAKAYLEADQPDKAKACINDISARCEMYPQMAEGLISLLFDLNRLDDARAFCDKLIAQGNPMGYYLSAATLMRQGKFKEAREAIDKCLEKMPNDRNAKELSDAVNARLGKADTSSFQTSVEPVALPEKFDSLLPKAPDNFEESFGAHADYDGVIYQFEAGKPLRSTHYGRYHVSTVSAIRKMGDLRFPFDPLYERIFVNFVRVYDASGAKIADGRLADFYTANDPDEVLMSQRKELHIPVPSLSTGCTVEYAVSYETLGNQDKMPFKIQRLAENVPTLLSFTGVRAAAEAVSATSCNGVSELKGADATLRFYYTLSPSPLTYYVNQPPLTMFVPTVWIWSTGKTWAGEVDDYCKQVGSLLDPSPIAAAKAKEILGDKFTPDEAVHKLSAFVRDSLTYQGIAFGVRAMIPNSCDDILKNRYGDCKDHSFLLMQMLNASGVKADLALADTDRNVNVETPDSFQFNHMIVYLPDYKGGVFIDATGKGTGEAMEPFWLTGSPCLILDKANPRIVTVPDNPRGASGIAIARTVTIRDDGSLDVNEKATFSGIWAGYVRTTLRDKTPAEYAPILAQTMRIDQLHAVKTIKATNLDDPDANIVLEYDYKAEDGFILSGNTVAGNLPASWDAEELRLPADQPVRRVPIWQSMQLDITCVTTVILPQGCSTAPGNPAPSASLVTPYFTFSFKEERPDAGTMRISASYSRNAGLFPAESRDGREKAYDEALGLLLHPIVLVKK
jgi:tetratricopeptide (TPR) repeat protein